MTTLPQSHPQSRSRPVTGAPPRRPLRTASRALGGVAVGLALASCEGYSDLPLALREQGALRLAAAPRFSEGPSRVEVTLAPPSDATGPFTLVGAPTALSDAKVLAWSVGPCSAEPAPDPAIRLCLAVRFDDASTPLALALVVDSRADARRFTLIGAEGE